MTEIPGACNCAEMQVVRKYYDYALKEARMGHGEPDGLREALEALELAERVLDRASAGTAMELATISPAIKKLRAQIAASPEQVG